MDLLKRFTTRKPKDRFMQPQSQRTRQMVTINDAPPAYSVRPSAKISLPQKTTPADDSPYAFLGQFDTVFVVDDSGSMAGRNWYETSAALSAITPICTEQDADGIDIYFLNHRNPHSNDRLGGYANVTAPDSVKEIFANVQPMGGTAIGTRLNSILKPYLAELPEVIKKQNRGEKSLFKPMNIIVITDGVATDDVESVIVNAAKKLDKMGAEPWQVGIQFFQVGHEETAAKDLQDLDDALANEHGVRDMVDTIPWNGVHGAELTAQGIMKVTMGAINRKLDRRRASDEALRKC